MSGRTRAAVLAVCLTVALTGCAALDDGGKDTPDAIRRDLTRQVLVDAGVDIVADERSAATPATGRVVLTGIQVDRMLAQQRLGGGIRGATVDRLGPMPAGAPPMSYLVAGWLSRPQTPRAVAAAAAMGRQDWEQARTVTYPLAVLLMFVLDLTAAMPRPATPPQPTTSRTAGAAPAGPAGAADPATGGYALAYHAPGPCSAVREFLGRSIKSIFDALKLQPAPGGGVFADVVQFVADVVNVAVDVARGIVQGLVDTLTKPVFFALRVALTALMLASLLSSYLKDKHLTMSLEPAVNGPDTYRFAVGGEPDVTGQFVARADDLTGNWPPALVDCAGSDLPRAMPPGTPYAWTVVENQNVITAPRLKGTVGSDNAARLPFTTGRESAEAAARGEVAFGAATVHVDVPSREIDALLRIAETEVAELKGEILGNVPAAARAAAGKAVSDLVDPTLKQIREEISGRLGGGVFTLSGDYSVTVKYHKDPDPSASATRSDPTATPTDGEFCRRFTEAAHWSRDHQAKPTVEAWAAELVRRFTAMRPYAPPSMLGYLDTMLAVFTLVAADASPAVVAEAVRSRDFPTAGRRLAGHCGVDPAVFAPQ